MNDELQRGAARECPPAGRGDSQPHAALARSGKPGLSAGEKEEQNVLVWGSPALAQTLMDHDLVDEYVLLVSPIVRVEGVRLFPTGGEQRKLRITESKVLSGGMLAVRMTPAA